MGKKAETVAATVEHGRDRSKLKPADNVAVQAVTPPDKEELGKQGSANLEVENVRRWRASGQARAWVERHQGFWNHDDWLALLEELRGSFFWPMNTDAVGMVLEEIKRERLERN